MLQSQYLPLVFSLLRDVYAVQRSTLTDRGKPHRSNRQPQESPVSYAQA